MKIRLNDVTSSLAIVINMIVDKCNPRTFPQINVIENQKGFTCYLRINQFEESFHLSRTEAFKLATRYQRDRVFSQDEDLIYDIYQKVYRPALKSLWREFDKASARANAI